MLWLRLAIGLFCAAATLVAQDIPAGTALPVALNSTLDAKKDKPGEKIEARLMQDVPLPSGGKIKSGSHVIGHVLELTKPGSGGSRIALKFDQLQDGGNTIPLPVSARAIAAMEIVGQWNNGGAWAKLAYVSGCPPHDVPSNEQAMWVFSVGACGLYGFSDVKLVSAGDGKPIGQIVLESQQDLRVGGGSGWFLIVSAAPAATK